jgi:hypothetical protein
MKVNFQFSIFSFQFKIVPKERQYLKAGGEAHSAEPLQKKFTQKIKAPKMRQNCGWFFLSCFRHSDWYPVSIAGIPSFALHTCLGTSVPDGTQKFRILGFEIISFRLHHFIWPTCLSGLMIRTTVNTIDSQLTSTLPIFLGWQSE